ncbi:ATP-binding SpoIIE family protein phosphatase [Azomonas macrocytogenes]|uniref:CheY-like chemotaxis protein n=1 Tax=Azomonas macrocytogenes TaxID=69962 RepID=A0A839SZZ8_AZOMA|nr:fused response regulator/phosphatase [Azomonas macrocytogenes]MBB3101836.1 CheY-like chemotaxis protein [Azomonas macrocytogenes]
MAYAGLSILVADDSPSDQLILSALLERCGHRVLIAANGEEAVALFREEHPQIVLMDAQMPIMDGFQAAREIKRLAGDELVPIIFLTSLVENEALVNALGAGGDDFLSKPYNPIVLDAKIQAMNRLRVLQTTVLQQRDLIARQHHQLLNEQRLAKQIFDKVAHSGCPNVPGIRYRQSPLALFNGDLLLVAQTPTGALHVLLGDFTGHGLPAAVGAMPLAETFYGMTSKGYSSADILCELNGKLGRILPVEMFCCAMLLEIDLQHQLLKVWSGGMPAGFLLSRNGQRHELVSRHLPLGVLESAKFDSCFEACPIMPGDRLVLLSDGVLETRNAQGEPFGMGRLRAILDCAHDSGFFDTIQQALLDFHGQAQDDLSLVEIVLDEALRLAPLAYSSAPLPGASPLDWSVGFELGAEALRTFNPLPLLLQLILQVRELADQAGAIYTVLAELYSNALEYGVLEMDSTIKCDAEGFGHYYALRHQRLHALTQGFVGIELRFRRTPTGGVLKITIRDSGAGFDVDRIITKRCSLLGLRGRGLKLVRQLCTRFEWQPDGRGLSAEFDWSCDTLTEG